MSDLEHSTAMYCPGCGYDLRALVGNRCPECGLVVDLAAIGRSEIPWSHRARLGKVNAFLKTVWVASANWKLISRAAAQPVSYRDAQLFRWIVVFVASLPLCAAAIVVRALAPIGTVGVINGNMLWNAGYMPLPAYFDFIVCFAAGVELWPIPSLAIILFMAGATGIPSFFFQHRDLPIARQNRAIALSYYTCAPLVVLVVPVLLTAAAVVMGYTDLWNRQNWFQIYALTVLMAAFSALTPLLLTWWRTIRLLRGTTHCTTTRLLISGILLPILWALMAVICLGVFPVLAGLVRLMIQSLR